MYNSSANSSVAKSKGLLFEIFLFLIPLPEVFLPKNLKTIEASPRWHPPHFEFLEILNALSRYILSEAVILVKPLKSL